MAFLDFDFDKVAASSDARVIPERSNQKFSVGKQLRLSLALLGGGAFGAFTWGVLDRLLQEEHIAFDAISGASAGAMNAVVLASGLAEGGRDAARFRLERFWRKVSEAGRPARLVPCSKALSAAAQTLSPC